MSDDNEELKGLFDALSAVGNASAAIIPVALRIAQRKAKEMIPHECELHQQCAAHRLVALTLVVNGMLMLKNSSAPEAADELIEENLRFAKFLLAKGSEKDEEEKRPDWMSDEQLRKMFEQGAAE